MKFHHGRRLAYLRYKAGLTQQDLTKKMPLSRSYISMLETGADPMGEEWGERFSQFYSVPKSYLLEDLPVPGGDEYLEAVFSILFTRHLDQEVEGLADFIAQPLSLKQELGAHLLLAVDCYLKNKLDDAVDLEKGLIAQYLEDLNSNSLPGNLKKYWVFYHYTLENIKQNNEAAEKMLLAISEFTLNDTERFSLFDKLQSHYHKQNKFSKALAMGANSLELAKKLDDPLRQLASLGMSAVTHIYLKEYEQARVNLRACLDLAECHDLPHHKWGLLANTAYIYRMEKKYDLALELLEEALKKEYFPEHWYEIKSQQVLMRAFLCHLELKDTVKMQETLIRAHRFSVPIHEKYHMMAAQALIYLFQGEEKQHWKLQRRAIRFFEKDGTIESRKKLSWIYETLAAYYFENKKYKLSAEFFDKKRLIDLSL